MPNYQLDANRGAPAVGAFAVTPHDSTNFTITTRAVYVGGTGNVVAVMADDTVVTFSAVPVGTILPIQAKRINATSTTATFMIGLY